MYTTSVILISSHSNAFRILHPRQPENTAATLDVFRNDINDLTDSKYLTLISTAWHVRKTITAGSRRVVTRGSSAHSHDPSRGTYIS